MGAVFRALAEKSGTSKSRPRPKTSSRERLDAGRVQQRPRAGVLPNSCFRVEQTESCHTFFPFTPGGQTSDFSSC